MKVNEVEWFMEVEGVKRLECDNGEREVRAGEE